MPAWAAEGDRAAAEGRPLLTTPRGRGRSSTCALGARARPSAGWAVRADHRVPERLGRAPEGTGRSRVPLVGSALDEHLPGLGFLPETLCTSARLDQVAMVWIGPPVTWASWRPATGRGKGRRGALRWQLPRSAALEGRDGDRPPCARRLDASASDPWRTCSCPGGGRRRAPLFASAAGSAAAAEEPCRRPGSTLGAGLRPGARDPPTARASFGGDRVPTPEGHPADKQRAGRRSPPLS